MIKSVLAMIYCIGMVVLIGCPSTPASPSPKVPTDTDWCKPGCEHLQRLPGRDGSLGCEEARVLELPGGEIVTCEQFCKETQNAGRNLYPSCWVKATKCEDVEEFRKRPEPCEGH